MPVSNLTFVALTKISQQLLDGFPYILQTFMSPTGSNHFGDPLTSHLGQSLLAHYVQKLMTCPSVSS